MSDGAEMSGRVHGGQNPIAGAHVYLLQANTTGYGSPSISLLKASSTGMSDSIGAYVLTGADGSFSITGDYTCTAGTQLYYYVLGGNPGGGTNAAASLLAALGDCATLTPSTFTWVNEVSTIATAYAIAGFATDATHISSSGTALAKTGIANAFLNAANLVNPTTGAALATTPAGNGAVPQSEINTLANILAACINTNGTISGPTNATSCYTLFENAQSNGTSGTLPTETATAAINIAHHPGNGLIPTISLFGLQSAVASPFVPSLGNRPNDFSIALNFSGGGVQNPNAIAIDAAGDVWVANEDCTSGYSSCASEFNSVGRALSPSSGFTDPYGPQGVLIDLAGNAWFADNDFGLVHKITSAGVSTASTGYIVDPTVTGDCGFAMDLSGNLWIPNALANSVAEVSGSSLTTLSPSGGYSAGGIDYPRSVAIDPSGYIWVANTDAAVVSKLNSNGTAYSSTGYSGGGLSSGVAMALDHAGDVWIVNGNSLSEFSNSGVALSPSSGWTGGVLNQYAESIAIDGGGNVWLATGLDIGEFSNAGKLLSPTSYGTENEAYTPQNSYSSIAIDGSGNVWTNFSPSPYNQITEFLGLATPVVTPILAGVKNNALGTAP